MAHWPPDRPKRYSAKRENKETYNVTVDIMLTSLSSLFRAEVGLAATLATA